MPTAPPSASAEARFWSLDPSVDFLNHGSYGACPTAVMERQSQLRSRLESEPVRFIQREMPSLLEGARRSLARFVGADPEGLAFVPNATAGVNTVLRSLQLCPGDELLTHDHAYPACRNALEFVAERAGARVVVAPVPFPLDGEQAILDALLGAVTARTRLALVDHVTSPTGIVFPVRTLVAALAERGIDTIVDGAHAPGMVDLDVGDVGAAWYTGNCHKWMCAPKGAAFLHARADRRRQTRPLTISHGAQVQGDARFRAEFDWGGTTDPSPWICVQTAIDVVGAMVPGGWPEVRSRNHALAVAARATLCEALDGGPPCPDAMLGSLASVMLPEGAGRNLGRPGAGVDPLQEWLFTEHAIEVPVFVSPSGRRLLRVSAQLYNCTSQYERLASLLRDAPTVKS